MAESLFKPLERKRLYEDIVTHVKNLIIEGKLKPFDRLPSERDLAKQFNVGRPTVREAIRTLSLMGLVQVNHGQKGTYIKDFALDPYMESVREQISWMIRMETTTLKQLIEVRDNLETSIALLASERATKKQLDDMHRILVELESCIDDKDAYLEKAIEFHKAMALATQNPIYYTIWNALSDLIFKYYGHFLESWGADIRRNLYFVNKAAYNAILTKDPKKIRAAMVRHIDAEKEILWLDEGAVA